jgi:hypothetical protein
LALKAPTPEVAERNSTIRVRISAVGKMRLDEARRLRRRATRL